MTDQKLKLVFSEGCFDSFEGTPEELAELVAEIHKMVEDGTILEDLTPLTDEEMQEIEEEMAKRGLRQ
jgi:alkanesulfonate monooxygenase SsuD/methylene tetrahydromethanopterin reductase-like flavin-dependent oxidoreductase (luciferase family)